jgi:hypothetical protein
MLIAGDVYDSVNPPAAAEAVLPMKRCSRCDYGRLESGK